MLVRVRLWVQVRVQVRVRVLLVRRTTLAEVRVAMAARVLEGHRVQTRAPSPL